MQNIKTDCPISGCWTSKRMINDNNKKDKKWEKFKFLILSELTICETRSKKNGLANSTGWKLKK